MDTFYVSKSFVLILFAFTNGTPVSKESFNALPFTRELYFKEANPFKGKDVVIMQNLLQRFDKSLIATGTVDSNTKNTLKSFQIANQLENNGIFDEKTANVLLEQNLLDGYKSFTGTLRPKYQFLIRIPVYRNRDIETLASLYNADMKLEYVFRVRTHGQLDKNGKPLNQLTTNGNTPTGLNLADLNTPEPDPKLFGPYPIVRLVKGLIGNSAIHQVNTNNTFLNKYRYGILIHTGQWENWKPGMKMPNSDGCVHVPPDEMKQLVNILMTKLKVKANKNTLGKEPYPFISQGLVSIENV